jgi:hypothetical protein
VQCFPILGWLVPKQPLKNLKKDKRSYEAYFNDKSNEATTLGKIPEEVVMPNLMVADYIDMQNMIIEYYLNDVFGTLIRLHLSS